MFQPTKCHLYTIFFLLVFSVGIVSPLMAVEQTDPEAVARYVLEAMKKNDLDGIFAVMDEKKKQNYSPLAEKRAAFEEKIKGDLAKIGDGADVMELRKCTTLTGKPAVAVKVAVKDGQVCALMLSQDGGTYSYSGIMTFAEKYYGTLASFK
jgi:hypothetical protein